MKLENSGKVAVVQDAQKCQILLLGHGSVMSKSEKILAVIENG